MYSARYLDTFILPLRSTYYPYKNIQLTQTFDMFYNRNRVFSHILYASGVNIFFKKKYLK